MLETEKAYWSVFRYCYVICHGCQMYFLWNPLSVERLECCHFSIILNKEGVFLLTFLFENFIFTECTNCFYWTFFNVAFGDHSFQKWKWEKENEWEKNIFCHIHTYCIKKFSDSLRFKNHEVQSTQHIMIVFK